MSDAAQLAKTARESLASALNALQSNAHVPDELLELAEPIADAMSVLHRIERSNGAVLEGREAALVCVRNALDRLQKLSVYHPAVELVMEAVAVALAKVHALAKLPAAPQPMQPNAAPPVVARQIAAAPPPPAPPPPMQAAMPPARSPSYPQVPAAVPVAHPPPMQATVPLIQAQPGYGQPVQAMPPQAAPPPHYAAQQAPVHAAPNQAAYGAYGGAPAAGAPATVASAQPSPGDLPRAPHVDVVLAAHSPSNFYKGLGGNDVIEHGGIFVATYKIPKIGSPVNLRVLLPGDYEFHANAVVQWTRESGGAGEAEPGFGARFTQITPEGRQLVYRYTRNREPLFYDDL